MARGREQSRFCTWEERCTVRQHVKLSRFSIYVSHTGCEQSSIRLNHKTNVRIYVVCSIYVGIVLLHCGSDLFST